MPVKPAPTSQVQVAPGVKYEYAINTPPKAMIWK